MFLSANDEKPRVSIVLPTYNGMRYLRESIDSCLAQTFQNWELIVVDDCSTDDTLELISGYAKRDKRIKVISNKVNKKLPASLNIGFAFAKGDYLTWTSDDNYYQSVALERMVDVLDKRSVIDFVYCDMYIVDENSKVISRKKQKDIHFLYKGCCVGACFLYRRDVCQRFGHYNVDFFCAEDYEYWLRLWTGGVHFYHLNETLYCYRKNAASLSATKINQIHDKTFEAKILYWEKTELPSLAKCVALFKTYKKNPTPEKLQKIFEKHPSFGKVLNFLLRKPKVK